MGGTGSGKPKRPVIKKLIKDILPTQDIFTPVEASLYEDYIDAYLSDFEADELISSDMDDIMNIAMNKVLAVRLLKESRDDVDRQLDIAATLEKLDKRNEKLKESLSTRRRDRINPNELKGFSIVDLCVAHDQDIEAKHAIKLEKLRIEEKEIMKQREGYTGNRYDVEDNLRGDDD